VVWSGLRSAGHGLGFGGRLDSAGDGGDAGDGDAVGVVMIPSGDDVAALVGATVGVPNVVVDGSAVGDVQPTVKASSSSAPVRAATVWVIGCSSIPLLRGLRRHAPGRPIGWVTPNPDGRFRSPPPRAAITRNYRYSGAEYFRHRYDPGSATSLSAIRAGKLCDGPGGWDHMPLTHCAARWNVCNRYDGRTRIDEAVVL